MNCRIVSFLLLPLVLAGTAKAQLGTGWTQRTFSETLDAEVLEAHKFMRQVPAHYLSGNGFCSYTNTDGVEEFHLWSTNSNRIEIRIQNDYQAPEVGQQFEGDVMLLPPTDNECLMQIFGGVTHATLFMLRGSDENGGSLMHYTKEVLATNVYNAWVRVNVIHMPGKSVQIYLNGIFAGQWPDESGDHPHFFKYGCYGTHTEIDGVRWKNVKVFVGGVPPQ